MSASRLKNDLPSKLVTCASLLSRELSRGLILSQQCNPQLERDILLRALRTDSVWAPHLLCAFQTSTHLNLVMDYIEGGTLWDVLESTPLERIQEVDLRWWLPQVISAIAWCHSQGFVHRHVPPHLSPSLAFQAYV